MYDDTIYYIIKNISPDNYICNYYHGNLEDPLQISHRLNNYNVNLKLFKIE